MVAYAFASSSDTPVLTRMINVYSARSEEIDRRNTLHQTAVEMAAADRHLFTSAKESTNGGELAFPE